MKAIYIPFDLEREVELISLSLDEIADILDGPMERIAIRDPHTHAELVDSAGIAAVMLVNEEDIRKQLLNLRATSLCDSPFNIPITGGALIVGEVNVRDGEVDFCDVPVAFQSATFWNAIFGLWARL